MVLAAEGWMQSCAKAQPHLRCPPLCWQCLASATEGVRLAARIVDTPCNEMNTDNFLEVGGAPDEWKLLIGSLDCSNQAQVVLSLGESCVSAVGRKSNQGCSGSSFGHSRVVELCKGRRGRVYSLEQGIEKLKKLVMALDYCLKPDGDQSYWNYGTFDIFPNELYHKDLESCWEWNYSCPITSWSSRANSCPLIQKISFTGRA